MPPIQKSLVASALKFTFHSPFINPSLASPDLVSVEKDHLVWSDSRMKAVFFTTGCVSGCNVITPAPGINNSAAAKKLLLFPIEGIFQEALSFFGFKFKVDLVAGQINNGVVTYSTKKDGQAVYSSSSSKSFYFYQISKQFFWPIGSAFLSLSDGTGSPKKKGLFKKPSSQSATPSGGAFPIALAFNDNGMVEHLYDITGGSILINFTSSPHLQCHTWRLQIHWFWSWRHPQLAFVSKWCSWSPAIHCCYGWLYRHVFHHVKLCHCQHGPTVQHSLRSSTCRKNQWRWRLGGSLFLFMSYHLACLFVLSSCSRECSFNIVMLTDCVNIYLQISGAARFLSHMFKPSLDLLLWCLNKMPSFNKHHQCTPCGVNCCGIKVSSVSRAGYWTLCMLYKRAFFTIRHLVYYKCVNPPG